MELKNKIIVVTGAASGIGRAMCLRFAEEGAMHIACVDRDFVGAEATAKIIGGAAYQVDVSVKDQISSMIDAVEPEVDPIDLFCSNAGISLTGGVEVDDEAWQRMWEINVMSNVWAARQLVPRMAARGGGYLLNTSSAAGLLNQVGSAPYGVTKHAAAGLAEWLAMTYGDQGIKVSVLCPQAVRTEMARGHEEHVAAIDGMMEPGPVAEACVQAIRDETFLVLPHPEVIQYMRNKTDDYDRWIRGMRRLNRRFDGNDS
jgi:NAD(P)-dependent dehydrogenase (short-subunit alcohol dehydrogenase family)